MDRFFQLRGGNARFEPKPNLRARLGVRHVPALGLAPRLTDPLGLGVIRMHLNRKLFVGKEKLEQQGEPLRISGGIADKIALKLLAQLREGLALQRSICYFAIVARQPGFSDLLLEPVVRVDWG